MAIISVLNQKGAVGKSTCTYHLGGTLAKIGRRVLLVDNDPQCSLSQGALGPEAALAVAPEASLSAVYRGDPVNPDDLVIALPFPGLHLLPNTEFSTPFNLTEPHLKPWADQAVLVETLEALAPQFDVILIDLPPNLYAATWAALAASDCLIIPAMVEDFGIQGLSAVERSINLVRATINPRLAMLGVLVTMFGARKSVHLAYDALLRETYGEAVFETRIPHAIDLPEATMNHTPLAWYKPKSAAAKALAALAAEVVERLDRMAGSTADRQVA